MGDRLRSGLDSSRPAPVTTAHPLAGPGDDEVGRVRHELISIHDQERIRIARDLHDLIGQRLTALRLRIEALNRERSRGDLHARIEELLRLTDQIDRELDAVVWELRSAARDDLGLARTLEAFVREWSEISGIPVDFRARGLDGRLASDVEEGLFGISQEALNNVAKHAGASHVAVLLEQRTAAVVLIVADDGCGFDLYEARPPGIRFVGLIGMRERAALVGAALDIETAPGKGTTILVALPVAFAYNNCRNASQPNARP